MKQLLPGLHGHVVNGLAVFSVAMALAGHCHCGRLAAVAPSPRARVLSRQRRWERLLGNRRLRPAEAIGTLARSVLASVGGPGPRRHVVLILDETPGGVKGRLRCMKLSVAYRKRVVPIAFECYPQGRPPLPMPELLWRLLSRAARSLPAGEGLEVTLLADRGLSWPCVLDCCVALGWHYVLRLQRDTRVRTAGGIVKGAWELAAWRGASPWRLSGVEVFKDAGWRRANVVATWEWGCREPWLLVTDRPATFMRCRNYCKRTWCEQTHRDEKSHGFNWQLSRVRDPAHAERLVLVMALATLLCLSTGTFVLKRGLRRVLEPARRRLLSVFQLGIRWLRDCLVNGRDCPCQLYLYPS